MSGAQVARGAGRAITARCTARGAVAKGTKQTNCPAAHIVAHIKAKGTALAPFQVFLISANTALKCKLSGEAARHTLTHPLTDTHTHTRACLEKSCRKKPLQKSAARSFLF